MRNHSKSLFFSLIIHALILLSLFSVYKYIFASSSSEKKEKRVCVNLACVKQKEVPKQKQSVQKVQPAIQKKVSASTSTCKPEKLKKKVPLKKKIKKEKPKAAKKSKAPVVKPIESASNIEKKVQKKKEITQSVVTAKEKHTPVKTVEKTLSAQEQYIEDNLAKIAKLIQENLYYPRMARKRGIQGAVTVRFILHKDATVTQITTISSNSGILTRAAIKTIAELSGKFPKPKSDIMISVPIKYSLY